MLAFTGRRRHRLARADNGEEQVAAQLSEITRVAPPPRAANMRRAL